MKGFLVKTGEYIYIHIPHDDDTAYVCLQASTEKVMRPP